jgi:hypothetical protein
MGGAKIEYDNTAESGTSNHKTTNNPDEASGVARAARNSLSGIISIEECRSSNAVFNLNSLDFLLE